MATPNDFVDPRTMIIGGEAPAMPFNTFVVRFSDIGKIAPLPDGLYLIDIARMVGAMETRVVLFIDMKGNIHFFAPKQQTPWGFTVDLEASTLPPPKKLMDIQELLRIDTAKPREAFEMAREIAVQTVVFDDERIYDLIVAWCAYTWIRGFFAKNINIYFTGFPGTGKSQALRFLKHFARYPTDYDPSAEKSYKWHIAQTLGTLMIDEGEYLTKSSTARLRKYHESDVIESRMMGLPFIGLTVIDLRVDAPIAIAATHLPADTAFLQRGFIIRMAKRKPRVKDFNLIPDLEEKAKIFAKTWLCNWFTVYLAMQKVYEELTNLDLDERVKDLVFPIAVILEVVGKDWRWVIDFAEQSFSEANFVTPETMAFLEALARIRQSAVKYRGKYVIPMIEAYTIIDDVAAELKASSQKLRYLLQYIFAGCRVVKCGGTYCFECDAKTVDHVLTTAIPSIDIDVSLDASRTRRRKRRMQIEEEDDEDYVEVVIDGRSIRVDRGVRSYGDARRVNAGDRPL